jgi:Leucine-rich repeat (LRR) protein
LAANRYRENIHVLGLAANMLTALRPKIAQLLPGLRVLVLRSNKLASFPTEIALVCKKYACPCGTRHVIRMAIDCMPCHKGQPGRRVSTTPVCVNTPLAGPPNQTKGCCLQYRRTALDQPSRRRLHTLKLSKNAFKEVPRALGLMRDLEHVSLAYNQVTWAPPWRGRAAGVHTDTVAK